MAKFSFEKTDIDGLVVVTPEVFGDARGFFMETYNSREFKAAGLPDAFVQDNHSRSKQGVLRGLHMQLENPQGKLVRVVSGEVFDVAVDMRRGSPTLGRWYGLLLSAENKKQLYLPEGFAHDFYCVSEYAEFVYKCTAFYDPSDEYGVVYNDPDIAVNWPIPPGESPTVSHRDLQLPAYTEAQKKLGL